LGRGIDGSSVKPETTGRKISVLVGLLVFPRHLGDMKTILLTLATVAILTIASQADEVTVPVLGRDVTNGGVTTHYGAPVIVPDTTSGGKWIPFPVKGAPDAPVFLEKFVVVSVTDFTGRLNTMVTPTVSLENGVVLGKAVAALNHDGRAFAGQVTHNAVQDEILTDAEAQAICLQNKSIVPETSHLGNRHNFVNGE
jgi:hypothetical protein